MRNVFDAAEIKTVGQIIDHGWAGLFKYKHAGHKRILEIAEALDYYMGPHVFPRMPPRVPHKYQDEFTADMILVLRGVVSIENANSKWSQRIYWRGEYVPRYYEPSEEKNL